MAVRRRGDKWVADRRDGFGVRRWVTRDTKAEAEVEDAKLKLAAQQSARPEVDPDISFATYAERWLSTAAITVKPATIALYRDSMRQHWLPALGDLKLRDVSPARAQSVPGREAGTGLSRCVHRGAAARGRAGDADVRR